MAATTTLFRPWAMASPPSLCPPFPPSLARAHHVPRLTPHAISFLWSRCLQTFKTGLTKYDVCLFHPSPDFLRASCSHARKNLNPWSEVIGYPQRTGLTLRYPVQIRVSSVDWVVLPNRMRIPSREDPEPRGVEFLADLLLRRKLERETVIVGN